MYILCTHIHAVMVATCCQEALVVGFMAGVHKACTPPQALSISYPPVYASLLMRTLSVDAGQCSHV